MLVYLSPTWNNQRSSEHKTKESFKLSFHDSRSSSHTENMGNDDLILCHLLKYAARSFGPLPDWQVAL